MVEQVEQVEQENACLWFGLFNRSPAVILVRVGDR